MPTELPRELAICSMACCKPARRGVSSSCEIDGAIWMRSGRGNEPFYVPSRQRYGRRSTFNRAVFNWFPNLKFILESFMNFSEVTSCVCSSYVSHMKFAARLHLHRWQCHQYDRTYVSLKIPTYKFRQKLLSTKDFWLFARLLLSSIKFLKTHEFAQLIT